MNTSKDFWIDLQDEEFAHEYADEFVNILIATQIKVLRDELTQQELADKASMKQERICLMENVNNSSWSISTLRRLAKAFDLRLRVTFESFSTLIDDMHGLNKKDLKRKTRKQEIDEIFSPKPLRTGPEWQEQLSNQSLENTMQYTVTEPIRRGLRSAHVKTPREDSLSMAFQRLANSPSISSEQTRH